MIYVAWSRLKKCIKKIDIKVRVLIQPLILIFKKYDDIKT